MTSCNLYVAEAPPPEPLDQPRRPTPETSHWDHHQRGHPPASCLEPQGSDPNLESLDYIPPCTPDLCSLASLPYLSASSPRSEDVASLHPNNRYLASGHRRFQDREFVAARLPIMAESIYSYYSDSDADADDDDSVYEFECVQAKAVHFLQPGQASIVDLMRKDKPDFKRASQLVFRRPLQRPTLSPVQPPKNYKRSFSPPDLARSDSESSSVGQHSDSTGRSGRPRTPNLDDGDSANSEASPTTPNTPKTSFGDEERPFEYKTSHIAPPTTTSHDLPKPRARKPSRFRMLTQRSLSMIGAPAEDVEPMPSIPAMYIHTSAAQSAGNLYTPSSTALPRKPIAIPRAANERMPPIQLPPSPVEAPKPRSLSKKHSRKNSLFTGRSKILGLARRQTDGEVGA